jgi:hypothetical protein
MPLVDQLEDLDVLWDADFGDAVADVVEEVL